jgi:hypothetical protein
MRLTIWELKKALETKPREPVDLSTDNGQPSSNRGTGMNMRYTDHVNMCMLLLSLYQIYHTKDLQAFS